MQVAFVSGAHPSCNPRLLRCARQLAAWGHQVNVFHPVTDTALYSEDLELAAAGGWRSQVYFDWSHGPSRFRARLLRKLASRAARWGVQSIHALGYGIAELSRRLGEIRGHGLVIGQQEVGLWTAVQCLGDTRVWVDIEDWYSRDLPDAARSGRPLSLLTRLESTALSRADWCTTTSSALAEALSRTYDSPIPGVIYNLSHCSELPPWDGRYRDRASADRVSLHWFSQTLGPHRGLEVLFQAATRVPEDFEIHLRGRLQSQSWFDQVLPSELRDRVHLHPCVPNAELHTRICEHDIGLALEAPFCDSRNLTITNKLFAYLQAGLRVIATRTSGQLEILGDRQDLGETVAADDPDALAQAMTRMIQSHPNRSALPEPLPAWCWEDHKPLVAERLEAWFPEAGPGEAAP